MPRTSITHSSQVPRARNRINNKTRLRVVFGTPVDGEVLAEETSQTQSYGVDAEDSNEHHLQAVLSANWQRNHAANSRPNRTVAAEKEAEQPTAYIPTPDSTGVVPEHEINYPPNVWHDPETYIKSSDAVEDSISAALRDNFTYFMDERDDDWLERNNEEARGEGTSSQGALQTTPGGRASRSAKAKGKEPDTPQPVVITYDEFELIMGVFEYTTNEKTPFLHHGLESSTTQFPSFADYQDVFSNPLSLEMFAVFAVPSWVPPATTLSRMARIIYPWWKERRIDRKGLRVIPALNYDEADIANESYICFRRREIKAIRKTRASQATSSDKLLRLQHELLQAQALADSVIAREAHKRQVHSETLLLTERRLELVELKALHPSLGGKEDEDLLIDKERPPKRPRADSSLQRIKIRTGRETTPVATEMAIRPRERLATISQNVERELNRQAERDHHWEDRVDSSYQPLPVAASRLFFKFIQSTPSPTSTSSLSEPTTPPSSNPPSSAEDDSTPAPRALRLRAGRNGRLLLDRRIEPRTKPTFISKSDPMFDFPPSVASNAPPRIETEEEARAARLADRWKFDADDEPECGTDGPDENDRVLIDDYDVKYMRYMSTLLHEIDHNHLQTDNSLHIIGSNGVPEVVHPYRLGPVPQPLNGRRPQIPNQAALAGAIAGQFAKRMHPGLMGQPRMPQNGLIMPRPPSVGGMPVAIQPSLPMGNGVHPQQQQHANPPNASQDPKGENISVEGIARPGSVPAPGMTPQQMSQVASPRLKQQQQPTPAQQQQAHLMPAPPNGHFQQANGYVPGPGNGNSYPHMVNGQPFNAAVVANNPAVMQQLMDQKMFANANNPMAAAMQLAANNGQYNSLAYAQQQQYGMGPGAQNFKLSMPSNQRWASNGLVQNDPNAAMRQAANGKRLSRPPSANLANQGVYLANGVGMGGYVNAHLSPPRTNMSSPMISSPRLPQSAGGGQ